MWKLCGFILFCLFSIQSRMLLGYNKCDIMANGLGKLVYEGYNKVIVQGIMV